MIVVGFVSRSLSKNCIAVVAQLVEHILGRDEVCGPIPHNGSGESKSAVRHIIRYDALSDDRAIPHNGSGNLKGMAPQHQIPKRI